MVSMRDFIDNPEGKGVSTTPYKSMLVNMFKTRYEIMEKRKAIISTTHYKISDSKYYIHCIVPSEDSDRNNTYDVLFELTKSNNDKYKSLLNFDIRVFSNCPSFTYTYAYTFRKRGMLIEWTEPLYTTQMMEDRPVIRNPQEVIGYDKSIFFSLLYIDSKPELVLLDNVNKISKSNSEASIKRILRNVGQIEKEIKEAKLKVKEDKKSKYASKKESSKSNLSRKGVVAPIKKKSSVTKISGKKGSSIGKISPKKSTIKK